MRGVWTLAFVLLACQVRISLGAIDLASLPEGFDPYAVLEVDPGASQKDVKKAYRRLVRGGSVAPRPPSPTSTPPCRARPSRCYTTQIRTVEKVLRAQKSSLTLPWRTKCWVTWTREPRVRAVPRRGGARHGPHALRLRPWHR